MRCPGGPPRGDVLLDLGGSKRANEISHRFRSSSSRSHTRYDPSSAPLACHGGAQQKTYSPCGANGPATSLRAPAPPTRSCLPARRSVHGAGTSSHHRWGASCHCSRHQRPHPTDFRITRALDHPPRGMPHPAERHRRRRQRGDAYRARILPWLDLPGFLASSKRARHARSRSLRPSTFRSLIARSKPAATAPRTYDDTALLDRRTIEGQASSFVN